MALQEDKHIKRIVEDKSVLSGAGPDRLKRSQIAIQREGSDRRLSFRDENNNYYEVANRGEVFGPTGEQGATGLEGGQGHTGGEGHTGSQGDTGVQGAVGETGSQGYTGLQGETGLMGSSGTMGDTGAQGLTGLGVTGMIGETGLQGDTGVQGDTGAQGITGLGVTGMIGETGLQGDTGVQGDTGAQGFTGLEGSTGIDGPVGAQGDTGVQGDTGLQGITGVANFTRGSTFPVTPEDRQLFWDNEDEILYFYDGATAMAWIDVSSGAIGATGMRGPTGPQGVDGPTGGATGIINFFIDGKGSAIATGMKGDISLPHDLQIDSWRMLANETGSILVGLWRSSYSNFPPTSSEAMHNGDTGPYIIGDIKNEVTDLSGWAGATGSMGDIIRVNVDDIDSIKVCSLSLIYHRT